MLHLVWISHSDKVKSITWQTCFAFFFYHSALRYDNTKSGNDGEGDDAKTNKGRWKKTSKWTTWGKRLPTKKCSYSLMNYAITEDKMHGLIGQI